jgi:predicted nucleic acid-binding protein
MIVVDTGAMLALIDAGDEHHAVVKDLYEEAAARWLLPSAILPEVDYLAAKYLGAKAQEAFLADLADGAFSVEWGRDDDLAVARQLCARYRSLGIGFVDAMVIAAAQRLKADAIATLDLRHFGAISIKGTPRLLPRDR